MPPFALPQIGFRAMSVLVSKVGGRQGGRHVTAAYDQRAPVLAASGRSSGSNGVSSEEGKRPARTGWRSLDSEYSRRPKHPVTAIALSAPEIAAKSRRGHAPTHAYTHVFAFICACGELQCTAPHRIAARPLSFFSPSAKPAKPRRARGQNSKPTQSSSRSRPGSKPRSYHKLPRSVLAF